MKYKCIKTFYVEKYDDDGFTTDKYMCIPKDSIWELSDTNFGMSDIQLVRIWKTKKPKTMPWIEVTGERLRTHFKKLEEEQK